MRRAPLAAGERLGRGGRRQGGCGLGLRRGGRRGEVDLDADFGVIAQLAGDGVVLEGIDAQRQEALAVLPDDLAGGDQRGGVEAVGVVHGGVGPIDDRHGARQLRLGAQRPAQRAGEGELGHGHGREGDVLVEDAAADGLIGDLPAPGGGQLDEGAVDRQLGHPRRIFGRIARHAEAGLGQLVVRGAHHQLDRPGPIRRCQHSRKQEGARQHHQAYRHTQETPPH